MIERIPCNAEGIPHGAHDWDFGSGETFSCPGTPTDVTRAVGAAATSEEEDGRMSTHVAEDDALVRRIADCLEQHLPAYGFDPYRYTSGENKSVDLIGGNVVLSDASGTAWRLTLTRVIPPEGADR